MPRPNRSRRSTRPNGSTRFAFTPDGNSLLVASGRFVGLLQRTRPGKLVLWDIDARKPRSTFIGHADGVTNATFFANGSRVVSGSYDGTVRFWDVTTSRLLATIEPEIGTVLSIGFSPDKLRLVAGGWFGNQEGTVNHFAVLDVASKKVLSNVPAHTDAIGAAIFLANNEGIVTGARRWEQ